jgi:prophage tail gpP-like protein
MSVLPIGLPGDDVVEMQVVDSGVKLNRWKEYSFTSNFLIPTDAFSFTVVGDEINTINRTALVPGANVRCTVNGAVQVDARIDSITYRVNRSGGTEMVIQGRDKIAALIDSGIDPLLKFNAGMNLLQFLTAVFSPFGFNENSFVIDNSDNVAIMSKNVKGVKTRQQNVGGKGGGKPLLSYNIHQLRPYPNEGAFEFATRVTQRLGLWLWLTADGKNIVAGKPNYDQPAVFSLRREFNGFNNILSGDVTYDVGEQPSVIIADGFSGGYEFGRARMRAYVENPFLDVDNTAVLKKYAKAGMVKQVIPFFGNKIKLPNAKPMFLHDDEAKTQEQLNGFVLREMSLRLRRGLDVHVVVKGHSQVSQVDAVPTIWTVDKTVNFNDEVSGVNEDMYILARTFKKSRQGGTTTELQLIRKNSLTF